MALVGGWRWVNAGCSMFHPVYPIYQATGYYRLSPMLPVYLQSKQLLTLRPARSLKDISRIIILLPDVLDISQ
jgi:hypothetical protein